jgi:hypothetical protein
MRSFITTAALSIYVACVLTLVGSITVKAVQFYKQRHTAANKES